MEPHLFRIKPGGGSGESTRMKARNSCTCFAEILRFWLDTREHYHLKPGDSLYFESSTPHRWKNPGRVETWLLWINTPPTFDSEDCMPINNFPLRVVVQSLPASTPRCFTLSLAGPVRLRRGYYRRARPCYTKP